MAMVEESRHSDAYRIGMLGAVLSAIGILTSGPLAVLVVALVQPQPLWDGPGLFVDSFHRIQTLPFYFGFLLAMGSIMMLVSVYLLSKKRATALTALIFMSIGAAFVIFNYVTQTTFIPAVVKTYTAELGSVLTTLSMSNPSSLPWALEMWGYGLIGLGTWLAAGFFGTSRLEKIAQALFILNGIVSVFGAVIASIDLAGVFSIAGLIGYGVWNVLYLALAITFYRVLQKRRHE
jgi:hypothetical protein